MWHENEARVRVLTAVHREVYVAVLGAQDIRHGAAVYSRRLR